ncbi:uncharacterized protein LOC142332138 [Lycorma delicatula]|uniref:uncharacterized protein LOC142332138 n=1 Tax=Lycorma delicatula TaxID=130591 RepID=UPI003F5100D9
MANNLDGKSVNQPDSLIHSLKMDENSTNKNNEKIVMTVAHLYIDAIDKHRERLRICLHEDAVLDWFGRTIIGNDEIITFLNTMFPLTIHYIHYAKACDPVPHRSKSCNRSLQENIDEQNNNDSDKLKDKSLKRRYTSPCAVKDVNPITNLINILAGINQTSYGNIKCSKIPKLTPQFCVSAVTIPEKTEKDDHDKNRKAIIIFGNLYIQSKYRKSVVWERKLKNIIIEYDSTIKLIIYEGASNCRKNLSKLFDEL